MYFPDDMTFQYFFFTTYPGYFLQALPIALIAGAIYFLFQARQTGGRFLGRTLLSTLFVCYITGLLCLTLFLDLMGDAYYFLFYHQPSGSRIRWFAWIFNFAPTFGFDGEQIGNFLMFLPFGILYPLFRRGSSWLRTAAAGLLTCLGIELLQPVFGRSFDINDIILNGLAVLLSATVFCGVRAALSGRRE